MGDAGDDYHSFAVVDRVDDPVVARSDAIVVPARELRATGGAWFTGERVDCRAYTVAHGPEHPSVLAGCGRTEDDLVPGCGAYARTSSQGTAKPRSSRACSAARLSSRYSSRSSRSA